MKKWTLAILVIFLLALCVGVVAWIWFGDNEWLEPVIAKAFATTLLAVLILILLLLRAWGAIGINKVSQLLFKNKDETPVINRDIPQLVPVLSLAEQIQSHLRYRYGLFSWRRKLRWLLVTGEATDVEQVAPGLTTQGWQTSNDALLIWGGSSQTPLDEKWLKQLKKLRWRRPIDAQVWVVSASHYEPNKKQKAFQDTALWRMYSRNKLLRWAAPLYLLDLRTMEWTQDEREELQVGTLFPAKPQPDTLTKLLSALVKQTTDIGMEQVMINHRHAFLLQLAQDLEQRDIPRLRGWLPSFVAAQGGNQLRGLLFTSKATRPDTLADHTFLATPAWQVVTDDSRKAKGRGVGIQWVNSAVATVLGIVLLFGLGCIVSYIGNRGLISSAENLAKQSTDFNVSMTERLTHQQAFKQQISQLQYRAEHGSPWYLGFGLSTNNKLLTVLWPYYHTANQQNIQQSIVDNLYGKLTELVQMPPNSPERAELAKAGYDRLKAYLMLSRPDRVDAPLLGNILIENNKRAPATVSDGVWQSVGPELMQFYANNLSRHPEWAIKPDRMLVSDARQVLMNHIGMQNAETSIYQGILRRVGQNYGNMSLNQVLNGMDSRTLFTTEEEVPGMFTRDAWEGMVEKEIDKAVKNRREEIDWVLTDGGKQQANDISPEVLKQRLSERYFTDYSAAWLNFLNSISWTRAESMSDVIDQLTLLADARQSPLIALMNTVKYQGQTAQKGRALTETLVKSAQEVFGSKAKRLDAIPMDDDTPVGPLDGTFAPLLRIVQATTKESGDNLSLQTYLTRVTRVRLKLQQITSAPDPQAMTQSLAKTVFEGKAIDLTDTRDYGSLIAASMGEEWAGFGSNLFVQPLEQAWQAVLEPAAMSFNNAWRESIADPWYRAFNGRYPFKATANDVSLPELGRFLRPDTGLIERFVSTQLGGMLHKQGDVWVADALNSQGLTLNPQFIGALNQLSRLSGMLYANGDAGMTFELMARPSPGVTKTELLLDGATLSYFNQMESWKTLSWPGDAYTPGAQLSWSTEQTGLRLFDSPKGSWGWVRLLEKANITQLDSTRYRVVWKADDGSDLNYILRVQSNSGPVELLGLKGFTLPANVFVTSRTPMMPNASGDTQPVKPATKPVASPRKHTPVSTADASTVMPAKYRKKKAAADKVAETNQAAESTEAVAEATATDESPADTGEERKVVPMMRIEHDAN